MSLIQFERWFFEREGSTLTAGLARILAVLVTWSRFAGGMVPAFADGPLDLALSAVFWVVTPLAFVGLFSRVSLGLTGLVCLATHLLQGHVGGVVALQSHHVFTQGLLCCMVALMPCGGSLSLDHLWRKVPDRGPVWGRDLLVLQVSVLYLGAVFEKSYPAWLDGSRMEHFLMYVYVGSDRPDGPWLRIAALSGAIGTWVVELGLAIAVWFPRWRGWALAVGFVFHALVYVGMPVGTFSATMFVFLLATIDGEVLEGLLARMRTSTERVGPPLALALLPLLALPTIRTLGAPVPAPTTRVYEQLALDACDVRLRAGERSLPLPAEARGTGLDGARRAAARICRRTGVPVDVVGRCATPDGWSPVELLAVCDAPPGEPTGTRRRSAL